MILFDSIIIGGGPAGASAGEMMARAGLKTLILEKATMPRYKCCAGGLPLKLVELLGFAPDRLEGKEIRGIVFSWKSGSRRFLESRTPLGWVVKREEFDRLLLSRAAAAGAEIRQGEEFLRLRQSESGVTVRSDRGEYRARTVIGADGAAGRVSRQLKLGGYKREGFALEARVSPGVREMRDRGAYLYFDFGSVRRGYAWIFPRSDHLSVGVATRYRRFTDARRSLAGYLAREGLVDENPVTFIRGGKLAFNPFCRGLVRGRCLLAGDAAGLTDPLSGEGIFGAIISGRLAAGAIIDYLEKGSGLKRYRRSVWKNLGSELALADLISRVEDLFPRWIFRRVFSRESSARKAAAVVQGRLTYRRLLIEKLTSLLKR